MMVPYVEGPKMDWTVDDALHSRFIRWRIKCENMNCQLAILQESAKCKCVIQWSGDAGLDMYISWNLLKKEITLQTIWSRFEDFCKPQSNAVHVRFDLLTAFQQVNRSIVEWYNAVLVHIPLCEYPKETAAILTRDIFWFFMTDNECIAKTINEGNIDLAQYPATKVQQIAKKLESSKATAKHINCIHPACKVLLKSMCYDVTVLAYHLRRKKPVKTKPQQHKQVNQHQPLP